MLIKYKNSYRKIAMGLLSFMPSEQDFKQLQQTIQTYEEHPDWQLYLWKQGEDCIGLIGIKLNDQTFTVHHAAISPSFRNEGLGHLMIESVRELQEPLAMCSTHKTKDFLEKCWEKQVPF